MVVVSLVWGLRGQVGFLRGRGVAMCAGAGAEWNRRTETR